MRIAVVTDVHGSLTALEAVMSDLERRAPDLVVHGGDLALMGPQPAEVVDRIRAAGWPGVVGNADELLWRRDARAEQIERAPKLRPLIELLFDEYAPFTRELLGEERVAWLRGLAAEHRLGELVVVHASPGDLWRAPLSGAADEELEERYGGLSAGVVAYGHIHDPFVRSVGGFVVANCGAVGLPFDGDPRAAYLIVDDGLPEVVRVTYDVERDAALMARVGHPDAERLAETRRRGRYVAPR